MATTTIKCFVTLTNGSAVVTLTAGNAGNAGISFAAPNVTEDMLLVLQDPLNATRFIKGSLGTTSLELQEPWSGAGVVGAQARISTSGAAVQNLTQAVRDLVNQKEVAAEALLGVGDVAIAAAAAQQLATDKAALAQAAATTATQKAGDVTAGVTAATNAGNAAAADALIASQKAAESATSAAQSAAAKDLAVQAWGASTAPAESLAAISQSVHFGAIICAFLYDTSKDSDAGQWRKRCADKSWYTEAIVPGAWRAQRANLAACWAVSGAASGDYYQNTTDGKYYQIGGTVGAPTQTEVFRGNSREVPALPLGCIESGRLVIYAADLPGCPMWMVFVGGSVVLGGALSFDQTVGTAITYNSCLTAINGAFYLTQNTSGNGEGLRKIDFLADTVDRISDSTRLGTWRFLGGISKRNSGVGGYQYSSTSITNLSANSVAVTILPDAPIDPLTGLAVPTIAVATGGGVSVIKHDGTVVHAAATGNTKALAIQGNWLLLSCQYAATSPFRYVNLVGIGASFATLSPPLIGIGGSRDDLAVVAAKTALFTWNPSFLSRWILNKATPSASLRADFATTFPTGWLVGDNKRCWLADTVAETVTGSALIIGDSSTFTSGIGAWADSTTYPATAVATGGEIIITPTVAFGSKVLSIPTVVGKMYDVAAVVRRASGSTGIVYISQCSAASGAGDEHVFGPVSSNTATPIRGTFIAYATTSYLACRVSSVADTGGFDSITCQLAEPDRSVKAKPITIVGTLIKTPVASGAALVAYSGFSASNYLEEPYHADFNSSGEFYWRMFLGGVLDGTVIARGGSQAGAILVRVLSGGLFQMFIHDGAAFVNVCSSSAVSGSGFLDITRIGSAIEMRWNGAVVGLSTSSLTTVCASGVCRVGERIDASNPWLGCIALLRFGLTSPLADALDYIHRTESRLVQPDAQCTLAGSSNAVTALAYDEETDVWHAGTSYGRTGFRDLLRVDSEVSTVGAITSISAANGAVLLGGATSGKYYQPAFLLRDEIRRKAEARRALGKEPVFFDVDAVASQTAFTVQQGYTVKAVYSASTLKRLGSTKDYTVSFDGFRETVNFAVSPGAAAWVSIMAVRA